MSSASWTTIVANLRQADLDSDADGVPDMTEIDNQTNPSVKGPVAMDCPKYGCGARVAPEPRSGPSPVLPVLGIMLTLLGVRRLLRSAVYTS